MQIRLFERSSFVPLPRDEVFAFFSDADNLPRLMPPEMRLRIRARSTPDVREGSVFRYGFRLRGLPLAWTSRIERWDPPRAFVDVQVRGPYRFWRHTHSFEEADGGTLVHDRVEWAAWGGALVAPLVERDLARIFAQRAARLDELLVVGRG